MALPTEQDVETLETMVDRVGLYETLSMLEAICAAKAEHIETNWQDRGLARLWLNAGTKICEASSKIGETL